MCLCCLPVYDNVWLGFDVGLCFNVGKLVVVGRVFRLLQVMEVSSFHGDGFWKEVQEDKNRTR